MYAVKWINVITRVVDITEHSLTFYSSLFNKHVEVVIEQVIEPVNWDIILLSREGNIVRLTTGDVVKLNKHFLGPKACLGETLVSVTKDVREDITYINRTVYLCTHNTDDSFCFSHKNSEYSKYLMFVYGLKEFASGVGLTLIPHMIYLLYTGGSNIKVGIANAIKNLTRIYEQIFIYASIIAFVENAYHARDIEKNLSKAGIKDRATVVERIQWIKKVEPKTIEEYLRSFITLFARQVKPILASINLAENKKFFPVIRFSNRCLKEVKESLIIYDVDKLNSLEGLAEVKGYCVGGLLLEINSRDVYIPYQLIRDRFINIDLIN
ncbi:MAG: DUF2797 domain-containing protein [Ignisphaera sp.]